MQEPGIKHVSDRIQCSKMKVIQIWPCNNQTLHIKLTRLFLLETGIRTLETRNSISQMYYEINKINSKVSRSLNDRG